MRTDGCASAFAGISPGSAKPTSRPAACICVPSACCLSGWRRPMNSGPHRRSRGRRRRRGRGGRFQSTTRSARANLCAVAHYIPEFLLWLFVINHGIAFGAGLYEQRIIIPQWFSRSSESRVRVNRAAMRNPDVGRQFWAFVSTGPLTLLTLANLVVAWQSFGPRHDWWLGAAVITLIERVATF